MFAAWQPVQQARQAVAKTEQGMPVKKIGQ